MKKTFEKELPGGYRQVFYINAKNALVGIVMNVIAFFVMIAVIVFAFLLLFLKGNVDFTISPEETLIGLLCFLLGMVAYMVLHELVHGAVYKMETGEKLTFGLSWSCAFCGVPSIYVYRKSALFAVAAPLVVFSVVLLALCVGMYFCNPLAFILSSVLFGLHLGGCSGDIFVIGLLLLKYRSPSVLIRDTGPEQFIYLPEHDEGAL